MSIQGGDVDMTLIFLGFDFLGRRPGMHFPVKRVII